jgi:hypothetical protein
MNKEPLKILVIDRPWREGEKPCPVFIKYGDKGYDVIIFPFTETKRKTEVIFFSHYKHHSIFEELFCIRIPYDMDGGDPFYDFDLEDIEEQTFYDILDQKFEVSTSKLTEVERR